MRTYGLSKAQQDEIWAALRAGESLSWIARHHRVPLQHVRRYFAQTGGVRPGPPRRAGRHLAAVEREEISRGLARGDSMRTIGARLGRPHSTVVREVARNGGRLSYRAHAADQQAYVLARRPKVSKLAKSPRLQAAVEAGLLLDWSPQQIARRLVLDHPADESMRVSHEAIYLSVFQPARKALRRGLHQHLRSGRTMRLPRAAKQPQGRGRIKNMVSIHDRPADVTDRRVPGHWEGDLVMGRRPSAVASLVERTSRLVRLVALPEGIKAVPVRQAVVASLAEIDPELRRTLTWDRGREMADHACLTEQTGCAVYFCDPKSPWQRGANENMNRLLRQYLAKNGDLRVHDHAALDRIAAKLNGRPREVLGWRTPAEVYATLAAKMTMAQ
jgi:IS30 family transposase